MKKVAYFALAAMLVASQAFAATSFGPVNVSCSVDTTFSLSVTIFQDNITVGETPVADMSFGQLVRVNDPVTGQPWALKAGKYFTVLAACNTGGQKWQLTQVGTEVTKGGGVNLAHGALTLTPFNSDGKPGTVGPKASFVGTRTIYTSTLAGEAAMAEMTYGITNDPALAADPLDMIPPTQAAGIYSGQVTFTLATY